MKYICEKPLWLKYEGKYTHPSNEKLYKYKKKCKLCVCIICEKFGENNGWSISRIRKFEKKIWIKHERSRNHKKSINKLCNILISKK